MKEQGHHAIPGLRMDGLHRHCQLHKTVKGQHSDLLDYNLILPR